MNPETRHSPSLKMPEPASQDQLDIREYGAPQNGEAQNSQCRLFFQLQVFTGCPDPKSAAEALKNSGLEAVLYADVNDPQGIGVLFMTEDPAVFTEKIRAFFNNEIFQKLKRRPEMTMIGRTYSSGREADLEDWLLRKPRRNAFNPDLKWAVWYPLRRKAEFETLSKEEQGKILYEHAKIGMAYGQAGFAHDIRLACHGLDENDNEFLLGILSPDLYPLSRLVQDMRKTQQTSKYIQHMGPFFVGRVFGQFPNK